MKRGFIATKYGFFEVTDEGSNGTILSLNGLQVIKFPTISWWDKDNIENALERKYVALGESNPSIGG